MHKPAFPPKTSEWLPSTPPLPPLPSWIFNPLTPEQKALLKAEFGPWAAGRTIGMISPRENFESHRKVAQRMYETFMGKAPPKIKEVKEPTAERRRPTAERRRRAPTIAEEIAPVLYRLTPEMRQELITNLQEAWETEEKTPRTAQEKAVASLLVVDWAEGKGARISGAMASEIIDEALARGVASARR